MLKQQKFEESGEFIKFTHRHFVESEFFISEDFQMINNIILESRPKVPDGITSDKGAFFRVVIPRGHGPIHLIRLILSNLIEGKIDQEYYVLVLYDLIERAFHEGVNKRDFRKKWKFFLGALLLLSKDLQKIRKEQNIHIVKYLIINRLSQHGNITKMLIPPRNRQDKVLGEIKIIRHREYTPTPKKVTKIVSNSAETKGTYNPDTIKWSEVASQKKIYINGVWEVSSIRTKPDPTNIGEIT